MGSKGFIEITNPSEEEHRIVLVGKTGVGKSASGNTILGRKEFESKLSAASQTSECKKARGEVNGRKVAVIDIPGQFDTKLNQEDVQKRIKMCISLSAPGPHVFLVVLQLGRFTEEERETVRKIQTTFGEESAKYTMVLFTYGDKLEDQTIEEFVSTCKELQEIISKSNGRYHVFNNKVEDPSQVSQLLDKIDRMVVDNGGSYYTNDMFKRAEKAIEEEKARLLKEAEQQKQKELEELRDRYTGEDLERETERLHQRLKPETEARAQAERENDFMRHAVIEPAVGAASGAAGAVSVFIGAVEAAAAAAATGAPYGAAVVGAAVGAAAGAGLGAVLGAVVGVAALGAAAGGIAGAVFGAKKV